MQGYIKLTTTTATTYETHEHLNKIHRLFYFITDFQKKVGKRWILLLQLAGEFAVDVDGAQALV